MTTVDVQVFSQALTVVIRSPTHKIPTCDNTPLVLFSTIGEADVCGEVDCAQIFIDGVEVTIERVGDPYGFDFYGADDLPYGFLPGGFGYGYGYSDAYGYGYGVYGFEYGDPYGYGYDDGYGYDGIPGTPDDTYGADALPGTLHVFQLPQLADGRHTMRVVVRSTAGLESEATETFIVDTTGPVIVVTTPVDDTITPVTECPVLEYSVTDFSGLLAVNVNIDGVDEGWLPSGVELDLRSGLHTIVITANDLATNDCPVGNESSTTVQFNLLKPIMITEVPRQFFLGTDTETKEKTVDAILEEFRVLNVTSTEADVLDEFKILRERIRFQLREGEAVLSADEALRLQQIGVESTRINLPDETLLLCHFDNTVDSLPGVGTLANPSSQVVDELVAGRRVDITVKFREGDNIDRELITELIRRVIPAFVEASIVFEEVQEAE